MRHSGEAEHKMKRIKQASLLVLLAGCGAITEPTDGEDMVRSYTQISQEEAMEMMARDDGHVIVDVRRQDEYDAGHIPGAILIPNEDIRTQPPAELPDPDQIILIYCRSGNRSKEAAQKLFDMGYTNIYEFGGINTWKGEIVTGSDADQPPELWTATEQPVKVRYDRMWEYSDYTESSDPAVITALVDAVKALEVGEPTDTVIDDYTDVVTFFFPDGGMLRLEFEEENWVTSDGTRYHADGVFYVQRLLDELLEEQHMQAVQPVPELVIETNGHTFYADFADNSSADAFLEKLNEGPLEVRLHDYGDFEKVGPLPWELPRNDVSITTVPGDVILYQGDQITIYYDENTWDFTQLAKIEGVTREDLLEVFGDGDVTVTFRVEWSE